ncbi:MAG: ExbD/TolR family protein [Gemmatimonadota bacterium]
MLHTRSRVRRDHLTAGADITLTNLIDVAFVLLIIFMITAPILQGGIEVALPKAASSPITSQEGVIVSITRTGTIHIGEVPVRSLAEFERIFPSYMSRQAKKYAYLKADEDVPHGRVMQVLGLMNKLDVGSVGMVADPAVQGR